MNRVVLAVVSAVILAFSCSVTFAAANHEDGTLHDTLCNVGAAFRDQAKQVMDEYEGLARANKALKEAGASYQKSLTAPTENLSQYTTQAQRAVMAGVYTFDAGYAALFLKKKEMGRALQVRKALNEKIGFTLPLSPKMKALIQNPNSIEDFSVWTDAIDEMADKAISSGMTSDRHLAVLVNTAYGMMIEGLYIVTESVAGSGYPTELLTLMENQHDRIDFILKLLNVFRNDPAFESALGFKARMDFLGDIHTLMMVSEFSQREVDGIRELVTPERRALLEGSLRGFAQN